MIIDCDSCLMREIACQECIVTVMISPPRQESWGEDESRAIDLLVSRGMVPPLRYLTSAATSSTTSSTEEGNSQESCSASG